MDIFSLAFITSVFVAAVKCGTSILLIALGETLAERAGILNLGLEGMALAGALAGFAAMVATHSILLALAAAMFCAGLMALIHAFVTVTLKGNQVVSGLALTVLGTGVTAFSGKSLVGVALPENLKPCKPLYIPGLSDLPFLGPVVFNHDILVYAAIALAVVFHFIFEKTDVGLTVRSCGHSPETADSLGINVEKVRYLSVLVGGILAGLGGAYLSLVRTSMWVENMTGGRGWIAIALVIFATWRPLRVLAGAYLFGGIEALGLRLQAIQVPVSPYFLLMLPYFFTLLVLVIATGFSKKAPTSPGALGQPYFREERD